MKNINWRFNWTAAFIALVSAALSIAALMANRSDDANCVVAEINGAPVTSNELKFFMNKHQLEVTAYFQQKYKANINDNFWLRNYAGEIPIAILRERAIRSCIALKVKQGAALKQGLIGDYNYESFIKNLQKENERRAEKKRKGEVFYGPEKFSADTYLAFSVGLIDVEMMNKLGEKELKPSETALMDYYHLNKEKLFKKSDYIKVKILTVSFADADGIITAPARQLALETATHLKLNTRNEKDMERLITVYRKKSDAKIKLEKLVFEDKTNSRDSKMYYRILENAKSLKPGQISNVFNDGKNYYILDCIEHRNDGYRTFEDVRQHIRKAMVMMKYKEYLAKMEEEAIVILKPPYAEVMPD